MTPERLSRSVWLVGGPALTDPADCLVYALDLGVPVLVDCGCGPGWPGIRANLAAAGLASVHTLVLTHGHVDHIGAAPRVRRETGCRIVAHALDSAAIASGDPELTAASWYGVDLEPCPVDEIVTGEGRALAFAGGTLHLVHAPGHTPGSMVAWLDTPDAGRVLFAQDAHGPLSASFGSCRADWQRSLERMIALEPDLLCEGHFGVYRGRAAAREYLEELLMSG